MHRPAIDQAREAPQAPAVLPQGSPVAVLRAMRAQRDILGDQLSTLQQRRSELLSQIDRTAVTNAARKGMDQELSQVNSRIDALGLQIANADQLVAQAAAVPGSTQAPASRRLDQPDPDMIAGMSFVVIMAFVVPITIAFSRRIWRRSAQVTTGMSPEFSERLAAMERGLDAVALEVERIGESQRFLTQTLAARGDVPALPAAQREALPVNRRD